MDVNFKKHSRGDCFPLKVDSILQDRIVQGNEHGKNIQVYLIAIKMFFLYTYINICKVPMGVVENRVLKTEVKMPKFSTAPEGPGKC